MQRNRDGWATPTQTAELHSAMPQQRPSHWWHRQRGPDPREPFLADLSEGRCACAQGKPQRGTKLGEGTIAGVPLTGPAFLFLMTQELQVFYWPHTHRVLNWATPPVHVEPPVYTIVRRSTEGREIDRATITMA